jgi:hypothetical protein
VVRKYSLSIVSKIDVIVAVFALLRMHSWPVPCANFDMPTVVK